jgi:hypothetical protein
MARAPHLEHGEPAPATGVYLEHNVFGSPTGRQAVVNKGEPLPRTPIGFTWVPKEIA